MDRLFKDVEKRIKADWGPGWYKLGPTIQAAIRGQGILTLLHAQDDTIEPERLKLMIEEGYAWAHQHVEVG